MARINDFLIWAEENDWCMYCERTDSMVWSETYPGEAYEAYVDTQKLKSLTERMKENDLND